MMENEDFSLLTLHTLASGSEGNCLVISLADTHLLIDAGISLRRIKTALAQLNLCMDDLSAILLTHEHTDHTCALATLIKHHDTPLYASAATARQLQQRLGCSLPQMHIVHSGELLDLGNCRISVFATSHDTGESVDYRIDGGGSSVGVLTDTGFVTPEAMQVLQGVELLVLESNHDVEWLLSGPYPYYLKDRILSRRGHLSNEDAAAFAVDMARSGTREIILAHLSRENNTPQRALDTVQRALSAAGLSPRVSVAPRSELSQCYEPEGRACRE